MLSIFSVVKLEEILYTTPSEKLTKEFVEETVARISLDYTDSTTKSYSLLDIPHLYASSSSAYYHGYGMAILAVYQLREYMYDRDGYVVDNPAIGPRLQT